MSQANRSTVSDADTVDRVLPQTQCTKCGYEGCRPYAEAIASGEAPINRCPPGGRAGIERLAQLTGLPALPLDPDCGIEQPRRIAWIDPERCIGCTLCIQACPVDAIIGGPKWLHAVIDARCTGCDLCLPPCPVDCIEMRAAPSPQWTTADADRSRRYMLARKARQQSRATQSARARGDAGKRALIDQVLAQARGERGPNPEGDRGISPAGERGTNPAGEPR